MSDPTLVPGEPVLKPISTLHRGSGASLGGESQSGERLSRPSSCRPDLPEKSMIACRTIKILTAAGWKGRNKSSSRSRWNSSAARSRKQRCSRSPPPMKKSNDIAGRRQDLAASRGSRKTEWQSVGYLLLPCEGLKKDGLDSSFAPAACFSIFATLFPMTSTT